MRFIYIDDLPHAFFRHKSAWTVAMFNVIRTRSHCTGIKQLYMDIYGSALISKDEDYVLDGLTAVGVYLKSKTLKNWIPFHEIFRIATNVLAGVHDSKLLKPASLTKLSSKCYNTLQFVK